MRNKYQIRAQAYFHRVAALLSSHSGKTSRLNFIALGAEKGKLSHLHDKRTFSEAIESEINALSGGNPDNEKFAYIERGIYADQIERYFNIVPRDNILIIESKALQHDLGSSAKRLCAFLNIEHIEFETRKVNASRVDNKSDYKAELDTLNTFFKPHNERLYHLLGHSYSW